MKFIVKRLIKGVKKLLHILNFPRHIKHYYLRRKIKRHKGGASTEVTEEKKEIGVINFLLLVTVVIGVIYINLVYKDWRILTATGALAVIAGSWILFRKIKELKEEDKCLEIEKLILKDKEGKNIRKWDIHNYTSCLIGKNTKKSKVDIDLSAATYSSLISKEHAVMNNTGDKWYFEDIGSSNGSGIRKKHTGEKFKVEPGKPYQINSGDALYIANTKLLVK